MYFDLVSFGEALVGSAHNEVACGDFNVPDRAWRGRCCVSKPEIIGIATGGRVAIAWHHDYERSVDADLVDEGTDCGTYVENHRKNLAVENSDREELLTVD